MSFTSIDFRRTMGHFATGINVVTTVLDGTYYGITVNAFCSVSLEPPQALICIDKTTYTHEVLKKSKVFAVSMLSGEQQYLSERFAQHDSTGGKTFDDLNLRALETGSPVFEKALAYLDCKIVAEYEGGDHTIFLGEVLALGYSEAQNPAPLLYYCSEYRILDEK
ncbi:MAG: flavin reductase [Chloroflexi bacterium]|uniref:Flavin reductase n=1 Tax=Candidatus Chlorohelix allophototropha TaxID=3003348 RepID=A0A8T7M2X2_9CHLR|nr:flavin reductase [Chloroflexota bacterium]WJW66906.1 flavin reductase family protein [Chloroflexota bacterium L227-S17]